MNNKISNPFLKQLISEIATKTNQGRLSDVSWSVIEERKKRKYIKKEAEEKPADTLPPLGGEDEPTKQTPPAPENPPAKDTQAAGLGDVNATEQEAGGEEAPKADPAAEEPAAAGGEGEAPTEDNVQQAKADAVKAQAELEKAEAEKEEAEQEIEKKSIVNITSRPGVTYLLKKLIKDAVVDNNKIDALGIDMADQLNIKTPEDYAIFSDQLAPFKTIPGINRLLSSIKTAASQSNNTGTKN